ncbi:MAG: hypothetical protein ACQEQG_01060 [Bacillota bacterium]
MLPNIVAIPLAGSLIDSGASYTIIAAFLTTLTMFGFITFCAIIAIGYLTSWLAER